MNEKKIYRAKVDYIDYNKWEVLFIDKDSTWILVDDTNDVILRPYNRDSIIGIRVKKENFDNYFERYELAESFDKLFTSMFKSLESYDDRERD